MTGVYRDILAVDHEFVSFDLDEQDQALIDECAGSVLEQEARGLSGSIASAVDDPRLSILRPEGPLLRAEVARAFAKGGFATVCHFLASFSPRFLGQSLGLEGKAGVAVAALHQPRIAVTATPYGATAVSGKLTGVFGAKRPEIVVVPYVKTEAGEAVSLVLWLQGTSDGVSDAPLVHFELEVVEAEPALVCAIPAGHDYLFNLVTLECAALLGLINEASEAAFDYAIRRYSFGKPIIQHQLVADRAAENVIRNASHSLILQQIIFDGMRHGAETVAKRLAVFLESLQTMAHQSLRDALQTFAATGIVEDHRYVRDTYEQAQLFTIQLCDFGGIGDD